RRVLFRSLERRLDLDVGAVERDVKLTVLPPQKRDACRGEQRKRERDARGELRPGRRLGRRLSRRLGRRLGRGRRGQEVLVSVGQRFFGHDRRRGGGAAYCLCGEVDMPAAAATRSGDAEPALELSELAAAHG